MKRAILITGAARGFGRALLEESVKRGFTAFAIVRQLADATNLQATVGDACVPIIGDVTRPEVEHAIRATLSQAEQPLDALINNAGIAGTGTRLDDVNFDELLNAFSVHCVGAARCAKACLPFLLKAQHPIIVNVTSRLGSLTKNAQGDFLDEQHSYAYRIAKAAQNMLTLCMANDPSLKRIHSVALHPGRMRTALGGEDAPVSPGQAADQCLDWLATIPRSEHRFVTALNEPLPW